MSDAANDALVTVNNPRTGEVLYTFPEPTPEEVDQVYARARAVYPKIAAMSVAQRVAELGKLKAYLMANRREIARKISLETGKSLFDALAMEVFPAVDLITYYEKHAVRMLKDQRVPTPVMLIGKKSKVV